MIDVDLPVLTTIATALDDGAEGLDGLAGSVPSGTQAGPMTAVIASMLAQVTDSAGNVSIFMAETADTVRMAKQYYERADAAADADFARINEVMTP